jgi:hypothetical protein
MKPEIGKTYLNGIPHNEKEISFQHPAIKGIYANVQEAILKEGLNIPNSAQTASLVYDAFQNKEGQFESEIIKTLKNNWFWEFTGNLYLQKGKGDVQGGVIVQYNPEIKNRKIIMDRSSLTKKLESNDSNIKFVPFGFKIGEQSIKDLEKNPYIIARYGEEGAEKIAKVAYEFKNKPYIWSFDSVDEEKVRVSALVDYWVVDGLGVGGDDFGDGNRGLAFGVFKRSEKK